MKDGRPPGTSLPRLEAAKKAVGESQPWGEMGRLEPRVRGVSRVMQPRPDLKSKARRKQGEGPDPALFLTSDLLPCWPLAEPSYR